MLEIIKTIIEKIRYFFSKEKCYDDMAKKGYARNGRCHGLVGGDKTTDYLQYGCIGCPYREFYISKGGKE